MNTITLGTKPVYDPPNGSKAVSNYFMLHTGAARVGMGKFLMARADYDAIATRATVKLKMTADGSPGLELDVVVAGAQPFSTSTNGANDVVEVLVFDLRAKDNSPLRKAYNVAHLGIHPVKLFPSTAFGGSGNTEWTWTQLVDDLEVTRTDATLPTTWKPRNCYWDNVSKDRIVDDVVARLYLIAGFDGTRVRLYDPGRANPSNDAQRNAASPFVIDGGVTSRNLAARLPGKFVVTFPGIDLGSADPYATAVRQYTKDVSNTTGDPLLVQSLHIGEYQAIRQGGAWANQTELDAVATDMAGRVVAAMRATVEEKAYAGIWPFKLDGQIRGIMWTSQPPGEVNKGGARTIVRYNNGNDFSPVGSGAQIGHANQTPQNTLVQGLGETRVGLTAGGTRMIWAPGFILIPMKISASSQDGSNKRYTYSWSEVEKTSTGYGGWTSKSGGLSGTNNAYNLIEDMNGATGTWGNGVASTNLVGTLALQPVPANAIVWGRQVVVGVTIEYWFQYENGIDGACP